jgi:LPS export ABC transporter protein LptC
MIAAFVARIRPWLAWLSVPLIAGLWLLFGSRSLEPETVPTPDPATAPRYSLRGVQWTRLDADGQREFTADAESADYFDDESARYEQLKMNVPRIGDVPWRLTSPKGAAPAHEKRILMEGPVDVSGAWPDGEALVLNTPQLWVDPVNHLLSTEAGVVFDSASRSGQAKGLKANWELQTVQLLGNVRMQYVPRKP